MERSLHPQSNFFVYFARHWWLWYVVERRTPSSIENITNAWAVVTNSGWWWREIHIAEISKATCHADVCWCGGASVCAIIVASRCATCCVYSATRLWRRLAFFACLRIYYIYLPWPESSSAGLRMLLLLLLFFSFFFFSWLVRCYSVRRIFRFEFMRLRWKYHGRTFFLVRTLRPYIHSAHASRRVYAMHIRIIYGDRERVCVCQMKMFFHVYTIYIRTSYIVYCDIEAAGDALRAVTRWRTATRMVEHFRLVAHIDRVWHAAVYYIAWCPVSTMNLARIFAPLMAYVHMCVLGCAVSLYIVEATILYCVWLPAAVVVVVFARSLASIHLHIL